MDQRRSIKQKLVRQPAPKPIINKYGMTPSQIHKATSKTKQSIVGNKTPKSRHKRPVKAVREQSLKPKLLLDVPNFSMLYCSQFPTPSWFTYKEKADVSVVIPLYKSASVIKEMIDSWEFDSSLKVEIIYVDDCCPIGSKEAVIGLWNAKQPNRPVGRIYYASRNQGFATSCNIGAYHATGDYLIFLNADTVTTKGWLRPLIRLLKRSDVGIVGNLQLKHGSQIIDSAGSQWHWGDKSFMHLGRDIYNYHRMKQPLNIGYCPKELLEIGEREMVTGACLAMRKQLFEEVGGFNPNYRVGYWEDADLCLTVREKGYKVMFQPESKIYHIGHHSGSDRHKYRDHNINYFYNKWVNSGRIDQLVNAPRPTPLPEVRTILLRRSMASGDVLLAAAVAPALKKKYPGSKILFTTDCEDIVQNNPYIDRIVKPSELSDRIFQIYYNLDMAYEYRPKTNILDAYAEMCGVSRTDCKLYLNTSPVEGLPEKYVVFHCGKTLWSGRDWSPVKFEILANRISKKGIPVVCVGSPPDYALTNHMSYVGKTNVSQLAHIVKNAACFVGIDSFPMHVAQTFNVPGVCFFGSIKPESRIVCDKMKGLTADLPCIGCHHRKPTPCTVTSECELGIQECINQVSVDNMLKEIEKIIGN